MVPANVEIWISFHMKSKEAVKWCYRVWEMAHKPGTLDPSAELGRKGLEKIAPAVAWYKAVFNSLHLENKPLTLKEKSLANFGDCK